jgi:hypothetical protein
VFIPGVGLKEKIDVCLETISGTGDQWEEITFTANWDTDDYFDGLTQYGTSENGLLAYANFTNPGTTTEIKTDL